MKWNAHCHVEVSGDTDKDLWGCYVGFPLLTLPRNSEVPSTKPSVNTRDTHYNTTRILTIEITRRILHVQSSIPGLLQKLQLTDFRSNMSVGILVINRLALTMNCRNCLSCSFLALRNYDTAVRWFWWQPDLNYPLPTWEVISCLSLITQILFYIYQLTFCKTVYSFSGSLWSLLVL
jgi:hypothetical protein